MKQKKNFADHLPMMLVVLMVLILMVPTVLTIINTSGGSKVSNEAATVSEEEFYLTWKEYKEAHAIQNWNWNDAAIAIQVTCMKPETPKTLMNLRRRPTGVITRQPVLNVTR